MIIAKKSFLFQWVIMHLTAMNLPLLANHLKTLKFQANSRAFFDRG